MHRYKLAVRWADGVYEGFVGVGHDEDSARCHALQQVFNTSVEHKVGFKVISSADVPTLSEPARARLREDWEEENRKLDRW